jgi:diamine N-acetyltransferase
VESGAAPSAMILFMIILEPASADAIDVILKAEADARAGRFLIGDTREAHEAAFRNPDVAYLSAFTLPPTADDRRWVGFVLLKGLSSRNKSIELKRIIVVDPGRGYGRAVMLAVIRHTFEELRAHRLFLDALEDNARARHLYRSLGFREEGVQREAIRRDDGYQSLVMMSLLDREYSAGPAATAAAGE